MKLLDWFRFRRKPYVVTPPQTLAERLAERRQATNPEQAIIEALRAAGMIPAGSEPHVIVRQESPPGIEPPSPDAHPWENWQGFMAGTHQPGWSPCMFGTRVWSPGSAERVSFMFGIAKGCFGVYTRPHQVCYEDEDRHDQSSSETILATVTHLYSGVGLGLFADREAACAAADALLSIGIAWSNLTQPASDTIWLGVQERADAAWTFNGFTVDENRHAHTGPGGPIMGIWSHTQEALTAGKPDRMS